MNYTPDREPHDPDATAPRRSPRRRDPGRVASDLVAATPHLRVSRSALLHNAAVLRNRLEDGVQVCALLRADALGHGSAIVGDTLRNFSLDGSGKSAVEQVAVDTVEEATTLPDFECPLTILRPVENAYLGRTRDLLEMAVYNGWTLTLAHPAAADDVARVALRRGLLARVRVSVDTGLHLGDCPPDELPRLLERVEGHPSLQLVAVTTSLASGSVKGDAFTGEQLRRFNAATEGLDARFGGRVLRSASDDGALFFAPRSHYDFVSAGPALLGLDPTGRPSVDRPLRPAARFVAPLVSVRDVRAGETVNVGRGWAADRPTRVGVVPVGFADGYPRALANRGVMRLGEADCRVVGEVGIDLTAIDLTNAPHARPGDAVTVVDDDPISPACAYAVAVAAGTNAPELMAGLGPRVLRVAADPYDAEIAPGRANEPDDDDALGIE